MKLNFKLYFKTLYYAFFKAQGTPGRLTPKRFVILVFIFLFYPFWSLSIRLAYILDNLVFPDHQKQSVKQPVFIVGNFRSGTTLLHRLLVEDERNTSITGWEIYLAPSVIGRRLIKWIMRVNYVIGNPAQWIINIFDHIVEQYQDIHRIGLNLAEEDGQVLFHIWSTYDLMAFFPFPELVSQYIYYDEQVPEEERDRDVKYYHEVLKKHIFAHNGKRYISKNPSYSPKVHTLHKEFPDAKFINIVRNPLQVVPSTISLFSSQFRTYGDPPRDYSLQNTIIEHSKFWYLYPDQYLKHLPSDQYICIRYKDLVSDPHATIQRIYHQFGFQISPEYEQVLKSESEKARLYKSKHVYSLKKMGLSRRRILHEFARVFHRFHFEKADSGQSSGGKS